MVSSDNREGRRSSPADHRGHLRPSACPVAPNGLLCSRVLIFGAIAEMIEDGEFEVGHNVGIWTGLQSLPDLTELVLEDSDVSLIWGVGISDQVQGLLDLLWGARHSLKRVDGVSKWSWCWNSCDR